WVSVDPNRAALREFIDEYRGKGATFWVMTTVRHAERAQSHFPADVRDGIKVVYSNFHYALLEVPIP
ncbi:MAG: hypothetical protein KC431_09005, partial [Myxococcales bacterium]|nr:hypothetical protein [Myxococcales bacterium]